MIDYEGQEQEACYDDQWFKDMEYLEEWDDLEEEEEWDEEVNRRLDILDQDRIARENGEKPIGEWSRRDFKDLLHDYPPLRGLRTYELRLSLLTCEESIDGVTYCKRADLEYLQRWRGRSVPVYRLLLLPDHWFFERWRMVQRKLWRLWQNLGKPREKKNVD